MSVLKLSTIALIALLLGACASKPATTTSSDLPIENTDAAPINTAPYSELTEYKESIQNMKRLTKAKVRKGNKAYTEDNREAKAKELDLEGGVRLIVELDKKGGVKNIWRAEGEKQYKPLEDATIAEIKSIAFAGKQAGKYFAEATYKK